jgi:hypothetical protein
MNTTLKYFTAMAALALFTTLTQTVDAQKSASASMSIKAVVVESASVQSLSSLVFADATTNESVYTAISMQPAGFSVSGIVNAEIGISIISSNAAQVDQHSVFFTPSVRVDGLSAGFGNGLSGSLLVNAEHGQVRGKTSVWIEGVLQSESSNPAATYQGEYLVSVEYN